MAHTPALTYEQIKIGDTFTFDGDTTQDPCTVISKDGKGGTVTLESSRTGAYHPYAPEFLSKVATRTPLYEVLFTPTIWINPATGDITVDWCESFQYAYDTANTADADDDESDVSDAIEAASDLLSNLGANGGVKSGWDAASHLRQIAVHIEDVERAK